MTFNKREDLGSFVRKIQVKKMARPRPPLNALRAFESAGRHLSFTKAAAELNVTPAAISHQVKALEELLEVPLFRRLTRSLRLTDAGKRPCQRSARASTSWPKGSRRCAPTARAGC